ncbi:hypothetical protein E2C01_056592 [Portunus trituberculatus]|uniref:Uncharacterized protein n=1 Tax=Portunus trituberculatus TaxID=210409 RepID=A0A5B7GZL7_PORTR|nr:hypothetical protein [Portunus trituberculatus]
MTETARHSEGNILWVFFQNLPHIDKQPRVLSILAILLTGGGTTSVPSSSTTTTTTTTSSLRHLNTTLTINIRMSERPTAGGRGLSGREGEEGNGGGDTAAKGKEVTPASRRIEASQVPVRAT